MREFSCSPIEIFRLLSNNRNLIVASVKRDFSSRYRGSIFGILWSFITPILMLAIYTFVFSFVFQARWGTGSGSKTEFALVLFAGLMMFSLFAECINRAPSLITSNVNYVKKVVFPLEILPIVSLINALLHTLISACVWMLAYICFFGLPQKTIILFPFIIFFYVFFISGLSWFLASLGVFIRDISQIIGVFTSFLLFLSPIFYPISAIPEKYRFFLYMNPLTFVIEVTRDVLYWGVIPNMLNGMVFALLSTMIAYSGFVWFQKTRKGFADVL